MWRKTADSIDEKRKVFILFGLLCLCARASTQISSTETTKISADVSFCFFRVILPQKGAASMETNRPTLTNIEVCRVSS
jgi:hypothetical protein